MFQPASQAWQAFNQLLRLRLRAAGVWSVTVCSEKLPAVVAGLLLESEMSVRLVDARVHVEALGRFGGQANFCRHRFSTINQAQGQSSPTSPMRRNSYRRRTVRLLETVLLAAPCKDVRTGPRARQKLPLGAGLSPHSATAASCRHG